MVRELTCLLEPIPYGGMPCSSLMQGRDLVLSNLNVVDIVDSASEPLPIGWRRWEVGWERSKKEVGGWMRGITVVGM